MATKYTNLPGVFLDVLDGQLTAVPSPGDPIFLILGTTEATVDANGNDIVYPFTVDSPSDAQALFGISEEGSLGRACKEAARGGATNMRLWSVGTKDSGKREKYEELFKAYDAMYDQPVDYVVPYGVYLDDANCMDLTSSESETIDTTTDKDTLGLFYAEKINGTWEFAWWFPNNVVSPAYDADSTATVSPNGEYDNTRGPNIDRTTLTITSFHEVNFAYQLAEFCHRGSSIIDMRLGFIGVNPPLNLSDEPDFITLPTQANWVGEVPQDTNGDGTIQVNGSGLLGNKFMAGRAGSATTAAYRLGAVGGGFFAADEVSTAKRCFLDGNELKDANGELVDIGKYLSVMSSWATVGTGSGWQSSAAATYAGFVSTLSPQSAPTNKSLQGFLTVLGTVAAPSFDLLAGQRYVGLINKATRAAVITDGPTAALQSSDYRRLSTMRQVEECVDGVRGVAEPFLGEGMTSAETAALDTAIGSKLKSIQDRGGISGYDYQVLMTPEQKVLGEATVQLKIIPAFELRQVTIVVGLSAS